MEIYQVYLDTNTFLHFKQFIDIDWCQLLNSNNVTLSICSTVVRELDVKKFSAPESKLRERARKTLANFEKLGLSKEKILIKENLYLYYVTKEPVINWRAEGLDPDIADDRIIATILSQPAGDKEKIILVTNDTGLKLKARSKNIDFYSLPDEYLLPLKTQEEEEFVRLKSEIAELKNKLPDLSLVFFSEKGPVEFIKYVLKKVPALDTEEIKKQLSGVRQKLEYSKPPQEKILSSLGGFLIPSEEEISRYKKDLDDYIKEYAKSLKDNWEYNEIKSRRIKIQFLLLNKGNAPAEDIDVFCHFPDGFKLFEKNELIEKPTSPTRPTSPQTLAEKVANLSRFGLNYLPTIAPRSFSMPRLDFDDGKPHIKKTKSYKVSYHVEKLKHRLDCRFDPVFVVFPSMDSVFSFRIKYQIIASNVPKPIEGILNVITNVG